MNVRKFIAANPREAMRLVKDALGADAIILSNRSVVGGVEIMAVASGDMAMIVPTSANAARPAASPRPAAQTVSRPAAQALPGDDDDYRVSLSRPAATRPAVPAVSPAARVAPPPSPARPSTLARPPLRNEAARPDVPRGEAPRAEPPRRQEPLPTMAEPVPPAVMEEIRALRRIVEQHLAGFAWGELARSEPAKTEVLKQMLDSGFSPRFCRDLLAKLPAELDIGEALSWARGAADRSLQTLGSDSDLIDRGGVFALVGPTGVGKTTTTAKLAARCVLRHGAERVALVTTDGYRIGAHEQLRIYGRILGVPVYLVKDAVDLQQTLRELQRKHMVLIDTMGMNQRDRHVAEQIAMLSGCDVRRLLLLSATSRGDTLDDIVNAYLGEGLDGCILTKIDEAVSLAPALDTVIRHRLAVSYVSNGQRVPEDLHLPNRAYLLHRAFKEAAAGSAHRFTGAEPALMMAGSGVAPVLAKRA